MHHTRKAFETSCSPSLENQRRLDRPRIASLTRHGKARPAAQMTRVVIAANVDLCDASLGQRNLSIFIEKRKSLRQSSAVYLRIEWESSSH
jgi:hypothetical protein